MTLESDVTYDNCCHFKGIDFDVSWSKSEKHLRQNQPNTIVIYMVSWGSVFLVARKCCWHFQFYVTDILFSHSFTRTVVSSGQRVHTVYKIYPFLYVRIYIRVNPIYSLEIFPFFMTLKSKANPITGRDRPWGFQEIEDPRLQDNRHMKVIRLPALRIGRLPPQNIPGFHFC